MDIAEAADRLAPQDVNTRRLLAFLHNRIGDVLTVKRDYAGALSEYRVSLEISQQLAEFDPNSNESQRDLATVLLRTGDVFELQANYEDALRSYRQALLISEQLAGRRGQHAAPIERRFDALSDRQSHLPARKFRKGARIQSEAARSIRRKIVDTDATNAMWQRNLATVDDAIGAVQEKLGRSVRLWRVCTRVLRSGSS